MVDESTDTERQAGSRLEDDELLMEQHIFQQRVVKKNLLRDYKIAKDNDDAQILYVSMSTNYDRRNGLRERYC